MTPHADVALTRGKFEVGVHAVYRLRTCDLDSVPSVASATTNSFVVGLQI